MIYVYEVNIINIETKNTVHTSRIEGRNQKDAVKNFKEECLKLRNKYINDDGVFAIGVKRLCKSPFK